MNNKLILGDCLEVLRKMKSATIDLIYLDPPFFSNRNYEVIWGDSGEVRSFEDRWAGGIDHYIGWLRDRVYEMHRILKATGSIYLHCDWHADAYIRVEILDKIFGKENFQDNIIWHYDVGNAPKKNYKKKHDTIFKYSKSKDFVFYLPKIEVLNTKRYNKIEKETGRHYFERGDTGKRCYADAGVPCDDVWTFVREEEFRTLNSQARERIGYPTQKPLALLERIIRASSNEGDVVLDPFMGGGTSVVMASRLNRNFIGIDQSVAALDLTSSRLKADGLFSNFEIEKHFYAEEDLKAMPHFEFEKWIVEKFGGIPNAKQSADGGSDGDKDGAPIQVKRWRNKVGRPEIQKFQSVCRAGHKFKQLQETAQPVGYFIAFDFVKEAIEELARLRLKDEIIIEKVLVREIVPLAKRPNAVITWRKLEDGCYEFVATSGSNIINFSWDFCYPVPAHKYPPSRLMREEPDNEELAVLKPTVLFDKKGVQIHNFSSSGTYNVAVKIVDDKCLENVVVCTISV